MNAPRPRPSPHTAAPADRLGEGEQQLEGMESELAQREAALGSLRLRASREQEELRKVIAGLQVQPADPGLRMLLDSDSLGPTSLAAEARAAAEVARREAIDARGHAVQAWEQELHQADAALNRHVAALARAKQAAQQALEAEKAVRARAEARAREEASPFDPPPARPSSANGAPILLERRPAAPPAARPPPAPRPQEQRPHSEPRPHAEQRAHARARFEAAIDFESDHNFYTGFSADISEGGLFLATVNILPLGAKVDLTFSLPGGKPISASGVVRWIREPMDDMRVFPGMGIQFDELPSDARGALQKFIAHRDPLFYVD